MFGTSRKRPRPRIEDFTIGWICARPVERAAAIQILDEEYLYESIISSAYTLGRIGVHHVVVACLPSEQMEANSAAVIATQIYDTFPSVRVGLMVGIGGGVPSTEFDIRLGDVAVSQPRLNHGGMIQYEFDKTAPNGTKRTGLLNMPPRTLLNALRRLQSHHLISINDILSHLSAFKDLPGFSYNHARTDVLFESSYNHAGGFTCDRCSKDKTVFRASRANQEPVIHYGTIASGTQVIGSGIDRDIIKSQLGEVICFETEAAGLTNTFPCLVIRGICDYADSHKNTQWQPYAAATAAAYAKELLMVLPGSEVAQLPIWNDGPREIQGLFTPYIAALCLSKHKSLISCYFRQLYD